MGLTSRLGRIVLGMKLKFEVQGRYLGNQETIVVSFKIRLAFSIYLNRASNISFSPLGAPAGLVPVYIYIGSGNNKKI